MFRVSRISTVLWGISAFTFLFFGLSTRSSALPSEEARIRALEQRFAVAFKAKDVDQIMANYEHAQYLSFFDVVPRREHLGWDAYKADWEGFFASIGPIISFEVRDLTVHVEGNLAYGYSFQHYLAKTKAGGSRDVTVRVTDLVTNRVVTPTAQFTVAGK